MSETVSSISIADKERIVGEFLAWLKCWGVELSVADYDGCPYAIMNILGDHPELAKHYATFGFHKAALPNP